MSPLRKATALALLSLTFFLPTATATAQASDPGPARLKQMQREQLSRRVGERRAEAEVPGGMVRRGSPRDEGDPASMQASGRGALPSRGEPFSIEALGTNVRANNRATDLTPNSTQAEESIAAWKQYVLVAWNDGEKAANAPPNNDVIGYGFSTNGGATFTDGGTPPKGLNWTWISDPVVTVNEKTGTFYLCALADSTPNFNGIAIVPATFSGASLVWGAPVMIRKVSSTTLFVDKPWAVADSTSDSLYVSYTTFTIFGYDHIQFQRSPNGTAWTPAVTLSAGPDSGYVQGSRPAVGPNGEVYVVWSAVGPIDVDFFRIRRSTNAGGSFGAQVTIPSGGVPALGFYGNWGTGAPGYNRERGVTYPSIAVDRTGGAYRGRVYVTWNECINFYDDWLNSGPGAKSEPAGESLANDTPATATPFTVNNILRGVVGSASDFDYWSFSATQGQTGVFFLDSLNSNLDVAFRLFCTDGTTRLGFSGFGPGGGGMIVFTFPSSGTYYLRCASFNATTGGYRIHTKFSVPGPERARDHRDVFVTSSNNGTTWTVPTRVNADPGYFDNWLPEVGVGGSSVPLVIWYDWRDSPPSRCGGVSQIYMAHSQTGGSSWSTLGAVTDAASDWTNSNSNLAPNQGDYLGLYVNALTAYPAWADARNGDPDVYTLALSLQVTPVLASLARAEAAPDRVRLTWDAPGAEGLQATVYRRTELSDWTALARLDVPASARIVWTDEAVRPGARYDYRLGILESGVESYYGEARVDVPGATLALSSITPNPAARDLWVSFALPSAAPATLRLIDVAGREVRSREVGAVAGPQRVNLAEGGPLPMGIYAVKLTQGSRSVSARVSVVR
jgi:hypothetical protein